MGQRDTGSSAPERAQRSHVRVAVRTAPNRQLFIVAIRRDHLLFGEVVYAENGRFIGRTAVPRTGLWIGNMEHLWSRADANGGNRRQSAEARNRLKQAKTVAVGCR